MKSSPLVWFITGVSQGLGRELVRAALERGDSVIGTSRTPQKVAAAFPNNSERLLVLPMDLKDSVSIEKTVKTATSHFGHIDMLVNNAGYGLFGAAEETNDTEALDLFQINFFGLMRVTRAVLPHFRKRRSGHIINISSISGLIAWSGASIYNASKFAVEGFSETLAEEIAPFGISVTIVEPGGFRTNFFGAPLKFSSTIIDDYTGTDADRRHFNKTRNEELPGNPTLGAQAIIQAVTSENPPLHLLLGEGAYQAATQKLDSLRHDFETWKDVTLSTDF